jgi:hypothetical protein
MRNKVLLIAIGFALTTQIIFAQVPSYVPTNGLVGYWPFNGNANDESGNGNNGTVTGATLTTDRYGNSNNAYFFNHSDEISTNFNGISGSQPRTISFWMKNQNSTKTINPIWYGGNPNQAILGAAFNIVFNRNEQNDQCNCWPTTYQGIGLSADWIYSLKSTIVGDNQWHHWIVSLENIGDNFNQVKYYKDGVLISSAILFDYNNNGTTVVNTTNIGKLRFGKSSGLSNNPDRAPTQFLDEIGVWNRALTQQEIGNLYNSVSSSECLTMTINTGVLSTTPVTYTSSVNIYPNPANDQITIDCGNLANVQGWSIKITNMLGQEVFNQPMNTQQYVVPLNTWTGQGMYFVKIINAQNQVVNIKKIILQ